MCFFGFLTRFFINTVQLPFVNMWLGALLSRSFLAKAQLSDLVFDGLAVATQALVALFFGTYFLSKISYSPVQLFFYYTLTLVLINPLQRRSPIKEFEKWILDGSISQHLLKPYNFILFICTRSFAQNILAVFATFLVLFVFFAFAFPGSLGGLLAPLFIVRLLITGVLTSVLMYLSIAIFLYLAFFLESVNAYFRIYFMIGFFVTGGFIPTQVFGKIVEYLPQYYVYGAPGAFVATGSIAHPWLWLVYIAFFVVLNFVLYHVCIKRLEVNGG